MGSDIFVFEGEASQILPEIAERCKASAIIFNRSYNPEQGDLVASLIANAKKSAIKVIPCPGSVLCEKELLLKDNGSPYRVYTPFWRKFVQVFENKLLSPLKNIPPPPQTPGFDINSINSLNLLPAIDWYKSFHEFWQPGELSALAKVRSFLSSSVKSYKTHRDAPHLNGTSCLSPHLHFGEIHPQRVLGELMERFGSLSEIEDPHVIHFAKEIVWREFSYHLLQHFPQTPTQPLVESFKDFPYQKKPLWFKAWSRGMTGYPMVDAGMRQLWTSGWMHNRVRMVTASFLVKHLGVHWLEGARWFWDTLVDADLASNTQGWQWTSGCGADAAPFFRIFNPITQGEKFDPDGLYAARWCPELAKLPPKWIYRPWQAPQHELKRAQVQLGVTYPHPIVDHKQARERALNLYATIKKSGDQL